MISLAPIPAPEAQHHQQNSAVKITNSPHSNSGHTGLSEARRVNTLPVMHTSLNSEPTKDAMSRRGFSEGEVDVVLTDAELYRTMFRLGHDTLEIARIFKTTEAAVYNSLAKRGTP